MAHAIVKIAEKLTNVILEVWDVSGMSTDNRPGQPPYDFWIVYREAVHAEKEITQLQNCIDYAVSLRLAWELTNMGIPSAFARLYEHKHFENRYRYFELPFRQVAVTTFNH